MSRFQTKRIGHTLSQASIPKVEKKLDPHRIDGLLLRGCVVATYEVDNPSRVDNDYWMQSTPVAIYCDVLCYSGIPGQRWIVLRKVMVSQDTGGLHNGKIWKPRAAKIDITETQLIVDGGTSPANWDGDHVLIGFIDNNPALPVILRGIPHPAQDTGGTEKDKGHRLRVKVADGDPDFVKHFGSFYGLDDNGDFIADLTQAYKGEIDSKGVEPTPAEDGSVGNYRVRLPKTSKVLVEIDGGASLELDLKDGNAKLKLGDGAVSVAIGNNLQTFYGSGVKGKFDPHVHPTAMGPSGASPTPLDPYDTAINSTKMKIPNG